MDGTTKVKYNATISKLEALKLKYATRPFNLNTMQANSDKEDIKDELETLKTKHVAKVVACEMILTRMRAKPPKKVVVEQDIDYDDPNLRAYSGFECQYCVGPGPQKYSCACSDIQKGYYNCSEYND